MQTGWVTLGNSGSFVIDAYPVGFEVSDFLYVMLTVFAIGLLAAWYPAKKLVHRQLRMQVVKEDQG